MLTLQERRRLLRCRVDFYVEERRRDRRRVHPALNLGAGGMQMLVLGDASYEADPRLLLDLQFRLPTGLSVATRARIVSVEDDAACRGVGMEFVGLDDEMRAFIGRYVARAGTPTGRFRALA